ncbi:MAG: argininosuccinate synthase, partial [Oscillospiraceae bacterium]
MAKEIKKVVLAYSGGLDTSIIIPWLKENYNNCEVIAVSGDVGQGTELEGLEEKAIKTGASKLYIEDLNKEFVEEFIFPTVKAQAVYEGRYLLGTSFARPIIAKRIVEIAKKEGADAICHGCTGKGNDQVRFELTIKAFAPEMEIIAPWRIWDIKSRDEEIDYAEAHNIPLKINRETNYSKDKNLWHLSHEGLDLEDPANEPQYEKPGFLELGVSPIQAPDKPTYVTIHFEKGIPTAIDGKELDSVSLIKKLNELGGANGIGLADIVENRLVGMKSRGVYETPGGTILYHAHEVLETITLDKATQRMKQKLAIDFA